MNKQLIDFFKVFNGLGLSLDAKSGGAFSEFAYSDVKECHLNGYSFSPLNGESILFMDSAIFLESIQKTEENLKVKLFV